MFDSIYRSQDVTLRVVGTRQAYGTQSIDGEDYKSKFEAMLLKKSTRGIKRAS